MKVIILAGGLGTRMSEYTEAVPKPMVPIGGQPVLWHIMRTYARFGHNEFIIALGYRSEVIKEYFLNFYSFNTDFTADLSTGAVKYHHAPERVDWKVTLVDTGLQTMTGGRVRRLRSYIGKETCLLTYGDAVANIDIGALLKFHRAQGKMATVTAVHPVARFGELGLAGNRVAVFQEKPQTAQGWINGGFFVLEPEFFGLIDGDSTVLEREPLENAAKNNELVAYRHNGFWQCMDTKRERDALEALWQTGNAPWH